MPNLVTTDHFDQLSTEFFKKSHRLVFSQLSLSAIEQDVLALFLTKLSKAKWEDFSDENGCLIPGSVPEYAFTADVLAKWLNKDKRALFATLHKPASRLIQKTIGIRDDAKKRFIFLTLFTKISYENGTLTLKPNEELFKEIFVVSKGHAQIPHKEFRSLESEHAKRLFTIFCRFRERGELQDQSINDLHAMFGLLNEKGELNKSSYAKTSMLIKRIIEPAICEIAEKVPDLAFSVCPLDEKRFGYSLIKMNKRIIGIRFRYYWKQKTKNEDQSEPTFIPSDALELAIYTHTLLEENKLHEVTKEGLDALGLNMMQLVTDGFSFSQEMIEKIKYCSSVLK